MKVEIAKPIDRGVQQLMYVGELDGVLDDATPVAAVAAGVALVATSRTVKLVAATLALYFGVRELRRR